MPALRIVAAVELISLCLLLVNLATLHRPGVAALLGPVHGTAYLAAIAMTIARAGWRSRATAICLVPGVGATLAAVELDAAPRQHRRPDRDGA